jgi:uncharacterized Zn-binding protein involved in type VI secretion
MSAQPAARVGDKVAHTMALPGALTGLLIGAAIGVAIVATGGLGAIAIGAAIATTGGLGLAGEYIGESMPGPPTGAILEGSSTIFINGRAASRATLSTALCREGPPQKEATGAATVYFDGMPAGRKDEKLTCSAKIIEGSADVFIGGPSEQTLPMDPEVPEWLSKTMTAMMWGGAALATGGIAAAYGVGAAVGSVVGGFGGGYLGGQGARWAADKLGFGETGQRVAEVLGGLGGGAIGGVLGFKGGAANAAKPAPYSNLADHPSVGPGKNFTAAQKAKIYQQNMESNGGMLKSDLNGETLVMPSKSQRGVKPPANEAQVDHIVPRVPSDPNAAPGSNSFKNAQVLSRAQNRDKSNK